MKIGVIGDNPIAIETAYYFHKLGASVVLFYDEERDVIWNLRKELNQYPMVWGKVLNLNKKVELENYYNTWWADQLAELKIEQSVKSANVERVHKRFLSPAENIENSSRLKDLFRVVYIQDPQKVLNEQKERNPEVFEKISQDVLNSLTVQMEGFEDVDAIVDVTYFNNFNQFIGTGALTVGEKVLKQHRLIEYGEASFSAIRDFQLGHFTEMAIVGSGDFAALALIELSKFILDKKLRLFIITSEENPFSVVLERSDELSQKLNDTLKLIEDKFALEVEKFVNKKKEWDELDDFVKVKIPAPAEPIPDLVYFSGHNVTAIDRLTDQQKFFLTCEIPDFRKSIKQPENGAIDLKTIGVEKVFVLNGRSPKIELYQGLRHNFYNLERIVIHSENGFYSIENNNLAEQLNLITDNLMKYFQRQ